MIRRARADREPLSRERVIAAATALADEKGEAGVTMRAVAAVLGVEAMSLYNHVGGRDDILDGMIDLVFAEIDLPGQDADWRRAMRDRARSARAALLRHPWAVGLMDSRKSPGPATLRHHDAVLGSLRAGGFSVAGAARAFLVIDSYLYGFVLQELTMPVGEAEEAAGELPLGDHPHLAETFAQMGAGYDPGAEFEPCLDLILGALRPDSF
ncbi:TetR/AcrR family transcriptional regulator [Herbidospora yilanensis]|uniref:TetR/AcrR family transcriptional regulator n=1 Tax=Herbidospora yilanensis TaxID=354426 RepID=UPI000782FABF|nr:TetR/AcrR family transcriptional regulator [Herbidospora yilanensis]